MTGLGIATIAWVSFSMPTLIASLATLELDAGKNKALPMLWVTLGIGAVVLMTIKFMQVYGGVS